MNELVVKAVDYTSFPRTHVELMTHLVNDKSERPIFLVIDEVAIPLLHPKEDSEQIQSTQLDAFIEFLGSHIAPLIKIRVLFVLSCGRAPFLDWLGTQTNGRTK